MENDIVINGNCKELIKDVLFQEDCELNVGKERKILGVTAFARITGCETLENEIRASVKTVFRAILCDEEGNYYSEKEETESVKTVTVNGLTPSSKVYLDARVTECEKISVDPIKARATVEISGWFIRKNEIVFLNVNDPELYCKTEKSVVECVTPLPDETVSLTYTDEARMPVAKILDFMGSVTVDSVYPSSGTYRVDGDLNLRVLAITDNGQFITQNFSHPFSAESAAEFVTPDLRAEVEGNIKSLSFSLNDTDKRIMICDATIKLTGVMLDEKEVDKAVDVYSTKYEIEKVSENKTVNTHFCIRSVREKASSVVSANGEVREVLGVMSPGVSVTSTINGGNITIEGVITSTVLYLDEKSEAKSTVCEIPFLSNVGGEYVCETVFSPEVVITSLNARPRGSSDVEVTAEMLVSVKGVQSKEIEVISGVKIGEEKEDDDIAISLYIVKKGETLWEVAKALNTDENTLKEQNEDVALPLNGGEKILLYKKIR